MISGRRIPSEMLSLVVLLASMSSSIFYSCSAYVTTATATKFQSRRTLVTMSSLQNTIRSSNTAPRDRLIARRSMLNRSFAAVIPVTAAAIGTVLSLPTPASAAQQPENTDVSVRDFFVSLPSNWKIVTKTVPPEKVKPGQATLFSAIDFKSGSVLTVVQEKACDTQRYAQSQNTCDVVLPPTGVLFSEDSLTKDVTKLIVRHDDRDNTALGGTSVVNSFVRDSREDVVVVDLVATTTLPSGGVVRDTMGIDRLATFDRNVKAKVAVVADGGGVNEGTAAGAVILSIWLSAPSDEWQKPVMGTKLNQIWGSVKYRGG